MNMRLGIQSGASLLGIFVIIGSLMQCVSVVTADETKSTRVGIIGLDTSHSLAFTKAFNQTPSDPEMLGCRVVAAYPFGSRDIESSASRIPSYTEQIKTLGVAVVDSLDELLEQVDCVLLETNDGRLHLQQAVEVFRAGKPVFIDKPTGSNLAEVIAIFNAAEKFGVPMFSSSSLRFSEGPQAIRSGAVGDVLGCDAYSPCSLEPTHVDLFWYGIHGVETLFTCLGPGCQSVQQTSRPDHDFVVGKWQGGRIGTFRGMRDGKRGFGATAFGQKDIQSFGRYDGYRPLLVQIAKFFQTHQPPVERAETIELYAFMQAASVSKSDGGREVQIADVIEHATKEAQQLLANILEARNGQ
tara:strand:- start:375716 stop:376780 length:1065 start_codon:yes stop_codon:yes gene_type:complete